jgi:hypothetical protein
MIVAVHASCQASILRKLKACTLKTDSFRCILQGRLLSHSHHGGARLVSALRGIHIASRAGINNNRTSDVNKKHYEEVKLSCKVLCCELIVLLLLELLFDICLRAQDC